MNFRKALQNDYETLVKLWEKSVNATHNFLKEEDKSDIKREVSIYLPQLNVLMWYEKDLLIGFSANQDQHLEMLFLDPDKIGKKYGTTIIQTLIKDYKIKTVEVNKQNTSATAFYIKNGFTITKEHPTDNAGRPYPILSLELR